ncbi:MAG: divalent metal cation transporter [Verrucomicrobia bacterium]|nr:divalent metal cation transporter [Verrucomicrobiota bacterium]
MLRGITNPESSLPPDASPAEPRHSWWRSIGPALITACVVFGPGSLVISSNVGATYGCELLWLLAVTGLVMGTYVTLGARIGVVGGATPCSLVAMRLGRPFAVILGLNLGLICSTFQFSNNVAVALAAQAIWPGADPMWVLVAMNGVLIAFLFSAREIYRLLERGVKVMVGVVLVCFLFNLLAAQPAPREVLAGFIPGLPEGLTLGIPQRVGNAIEDPMILVASLLGTTFSVGAAFYQGNLVRERGWTMREYHHGIGDGIAGVLVLTGVSMAIMITTATVIPGQPASDIGTLAQMLRPLLGATAYVVFCVGLLAVALNPFLINAMIGGSILADGLGQPARLSDRVPRMLTVVVLLIGMSVAILALRSGQKPVSLIIFGQALTVLGNPLMAGTMLYLANRRDVMGEHRNGWVLNTLGGLGFVLVLLMAMRVTWRLYLQLTAGT